MSAVKIANTDVPSPQSHLANPFSFSDAGCKESSFVVALVMAGSPVRRFGEARSTADAPVDGHLGLSTILPTL
jgi:hypothetical protein